MPDSLFFATIAAAMPEIEAATGTSAGANTLTFNGLSYAYSGDSSRRGVTIDAMGNPVSFYRRIWIRAQLFTAANVTPPAAGQKFTNVKGRTQLINLVTDIGSVLQFDLGDPGK